MSLAGMERFLQILDERPDVPEKRNARRIRRARGEIAFRDVSFGYDANHPVLRHISFEISPGMCLGGVRTTYCRRRTEYRQSTPVYSSYDRPTTLPLLFQGKKSLYK